MSGAGMSARIERVIVPLDAVSDHRAAIDTAARLAERVKAPLHGVFVEDEELLWAAGLHFTRQSTLGARPEPFTPERTAAQLQANDPATIANREEMVSTLTGVAADLATRAARERARIETMQRRTTDLLVAVPCIAIVLGIALAIWFVRSQLRRPLNALKATMEALAHGDLDTPVQLDARDDEIGQMARSLKVFRAALINRRDGARTEAQRAKATTQRADTIVALTRDFETQATAMMRALRASVADMDGAAREVASGYCTAWSVRWARG